MESRIRTCIACRKKLNKYELLRIVEMDNEPVIDSTYKINSRGIYICKNKQCIDKLLNSKSLVKILKINVDENKFKEALAKMGEL